MQAIETAAVSGHTMRAVCQTRYGGPEVLELADLERPTPGEGEVLIEVCHTALNAGDWHLMRGTPFLVRLIFGGIFRPKIKILGADVAGRVTAVGPGVTRFQPGDAVFGNLSESGMGAFAEYACAPETALVKKPDGVSFETAAAAPAAAMSALQALRDCGQLQAGQRVLVHGASGGVGSMAVQIARALGAEVVGVCRTEKVEMVRSQGADRVIDYTRTDCTQTGPYDLIVDAAAYRPMTDFLPALKKGGTYVVVGGSTAAFFQALLLGALAGKLYQRWVRCLTMTPNNSDLATTQELLVSGKLVPFIDAVYPLAEVPEAMDYVEQRRVKGKVVISCQ